MIEILIHRDLPRSTISHNWKYRGHTVSNLAKEFSERVTRALQTLSEYGVTKLRYSDYHFVILRNREEHVIGSCPHFLDNEFLASLKEDLHLLHRYIAQEASKDPS